MQGPTITTDRERLDALTRAFTTYSTFEELLAGDGRNEPVIPCSRKAAKREKAAAERCELADAYDHEQTTRGDPRRAFRGH